MQTPNGQTKKDKIEIKISMNKVQVRRKYNKNRNHRSQSIDKNFNE